METAQLSKLIGRPVELAPVPVTGRYPQSALNWEIGKGILGAVVCVGLVVGLRPSEWLAWPLGMIAVLFALYALQQARRKPLCFAVDDVGVTRIQGAQRTPLRWSELDDFRLNFYPNGRKAAQGMLVVVLRKGREQVKIDSNLDHFPTLLARAAQAVRERQMELHPTTADNLTKLGL